MVMGPSTCVFQKENRSASRQNANSLGKNQAVKHAQDFQFECRLEEKGPSIIWTQIQNWGALPMDHKMRKRISYVQLCRQFDFLASMPSGDKQGNGTSWPSLNDFPI
jgi:hypothetical protein